MYCHEVFWLIKSATLHCGSGLKSVCKSRKSWFAVAFVPAWSEFAIISNVPSGGAPARLRERTNSMPFASSAGRLLYAAIVMPSSAANTRSTVAESAGSHVGLCRLIASCEKMRLNESRALNWLRIKSLVVLSKSSREMFVFPAS